MQINRENIIKAIEVMERVKRLEANNRMHLFDMANFQSCITLKDPLVATEEAVISCGTTCCFSGWLAIAPEFKHLGTQSKAGAFITSGEDRGDPYFKSPEDSLAEIFGIPWTVASDLIYCNNIYNQVRTPADVITVLQHWLYYYGGSHREYARTDSIGDQDEDS